MHLLGEAHRQSSLASAFYTLFDHVAGRTKAISADVPVCRDAKTWLHFLALPTPRIAHRLRQFVAAVVFGPGDQTFVGTVSMMLFLDDATADWVCGWL